MKKLLATLLFGYGTLCFALEPVPATDSYSQSALFKNWLLSQCVGAIAQNKAAAEDAFTSASAYLEFGNLPIEAYDEGKTLVKQYLGRKYSGSVPGEFNTMKCIDLFHSKDAERLFAKYRAPRWQRRSNTGSKVG